MPQWRCIYIKHVSIYNIHTTAKAGTIYILYFETYRYIYIYIKKSKRCLSNTLLNTLHAGSSIRDPEAQGKEIGFLSDLQSHVCIYIYIVIYACKHMSFMFACWFLRAMHLLGLKTKHEHVSKNWKTFTLYQLSHVICKTVLDLILYTYIFAMFSQSQLHVWLQHPSSSNAILPAFLPAPGCTGCRGSEVWNEFPEKGQPCCFLAWGQDAKVYYWGMPQNNWNTSFIQHVFLQVFVQYQPFEYAVKHISSDMFMAKMYLYKLYTARNQLGVLVSLHLQHPLSQVKLGCIAGRMTKMVCIAVFHFNPLYIYIYNDCKYI